MICEAKSSINVDIDVNINIIMNMVVKNSPVNCDLFASCNKTPDLKKLLRKPYNTSLEAIDVNINIIMNIVVNIDTDTDAGDSRGNQFTPFSAIICVSGVWRVGSRCSADIVY